MSHLDVLRQMAASLQAAETQAPQPRFAEPGVKPHSWQVAREPTHYTGRSRPPVGNSEDLRRILALPRRPPVDLDKDTPELRKLVDEQTARFARVNPHCTCPVISGRKTCITRLMPAQAWALKEISQADGLLGNIVVGGGKTGLNILAALALKDCKLAVLLVPPNLQEQLGRAYDDWSQHFNVPSLVLQGRSRIIPGRPVLHVVPYSRFSRPESTALLESLLPDAIIADEGHSIRNFNAARTARVLRYFSAHPKTRLCVWSGTLSGKSIKDFAHLSSFALKEKSPLPRDPQIVEEWSTALDPVEIQADPGALYELCNEGEEARSGFRRRVQDTLGSVATVGSPVGASLILSERTAPKIPAIIAEHLADVRHRMRRPDGEEFADKMQAAECAREIACGFYYRWKFPQGHVDSQGCVCKKADKVLCKACEDVVLSWYARRKAWGQEVRRKLLNREVHLDSDTLCRNAAQRAWMEELEGRPYTGDLPMWKAESWPDWLEIQKKVRPVSETIWLDDYLANDAAEWARTHKGLVWFQQRAFGKRVAQLAGLPCYNGDVDAPVLVEKLENDKYRWNEDGSRSVILSIKQYGTGTDGLQHRFTEQLVTNPPSNNNSTEQMLGRLHRPGQTADEVFAEFYRHTQEMRDAIDNALKEAKFVKETAGSYQKLLAATPAWTLTEAA